MLMLGEYLEEHGLDYCDVILKNENGQVITSGGALLQFCLVLGVNNEDGTELIIR